MKTLGVDVGVSESPVGWAFFDSRIPEAKESGTFWATQSRLKGRKKDFYYFWKEILRLVDLYKPEKVAACRPMGQFAGTIYQQAKLIGILQLLCERKGIHFVDKPDSKYREYTFGKKMTKAQAQKAVKMDDPDEADAMVAAIAVFKAGL